MKAGTTSFMEILSEHSDIYVSPIKEPHYFINELPANLYEPSRFFSLRDYFKSEFPNALHIAKISNAEDYVRLFSLAENQRYLAEASTAYLHSPDSAQLIHEFNAEAHVVIIVRDPIERAYSHFKMNIGKGRENRSFESVIKNEMEMYEQGVLPWNSYLGMSFYNRSLNRYKELFDKVLILQFEDLIFEQKKILKSISDFLKVDFFTTDPLDHKNKSASLRFPKLFYFLKQLGLKDYFSWFFSIKFKQWLFRKLIKSEKNGLLLTHGTTSKLKIIFKKESGQCYY